MFETSDSKFVRTLVGINRGWLLQLNQGKLLHFKEYGKHFASSEVEENLWTMWQRKTFGPCNKERINLRLLTTFLTIHQTSQIRRILKKMHSLV